MNNIFKISYTNLFKLIILIFVISGCEADETEVKKITTRQPGIEEGTNIDIIYTIQGAARARLTAPLMYRVKDTVAYIEFPKKIHVDFFSDTGAIESKLDALYARYNETESKVFLKDSVRFIGLQNGDTLYCKELYWDRNRPGYQFYTDKKVQIRTKTHVIDGIGFETSQDFKDKVIKNITHSYIKVPASEFPVD